LSYIELVFKLFQKLSYDFDLFLYLNRLVKSYDHDLPSYSLFNKFFKSKFNYSFKTKVPYLFLKLF